MRVFFKLLCLLFLLSVTGRADDATISITYPDGSRKVFFSEEKAIDYLALGLRSEDDGRYLLELTRGEDQRLTRIEKLGDKVEIVNGFRTQRMSVENCVTEMTKTVARLQLNACVYFLKDYGTALEFYAQEHDHRYPSTLQELVPNYARRVKACPRDDVPYAYTSDGKSFRIHCCGNHLRAGIKSGFPAYNSKDGLEK